MALVRKRNYKKIAIYSFFLIAVLGVGGYLIYNSLSVTEETANTNVSITGVGPIVKDYDQEFLESEVFKSLVEFGADNLPINYENIKKGRENPFNPF